MKQKDIDCYLISKGEFVPAILEEYLFITLSKSLKRNGTEILHFVDKTIEVEGIYIPAKGVEKLPVFDIEKINKNIIKVGDKNSVVHFR